MANPDGTLLGDGITDTKHNKLWYKEIFDFYTIDGAVALQKFFKGWEGGGGGLNDGGDVGLVDVGVAI